MSARLALEATVGLGSVVAAAATLGLLLWAVAALVEAASRRWPAPAPRWLLWLDGLLIAVAVLWVAVLVGRQVLGR